MIKISTHSITVSELNKQMDASYLDYLQDNFRGSCPLYFKNRDGNFSLITDCAIDEKHISLLKPSFPDWLYRGGGVVNLITREGVVVRFDDRRGWWKPAAAGIASILDGDNPSNILVNSALRELAEEIVIIADPNLIIKDQPKTVSFTVNEPDKAVEAVVTINISAYDIFDIIGMEDGDINPTIGVLNNGRIVGLYNQNQGYINLKQINIHPSIPKNHP